VRWQQDMRRAVGASLEKKKKKKDVAHFPGATIYQNACICNCWRRAHSVALRRDMSRRFRWDEQVARGTVDGRVAEPPTACLYSPHLAPHLPHLLPTFSSSATACPASLVYACTASYMCRHSPATTSLCCSPAIYLPTYTSPTWQHNRPTHHYPPGRAALPTFAAAASLPHLLDRAWALSPRTICPPPMPVGNTRMPRVRRDVAAVRARGRRRANIWQAAQADALDGTADAAWRAGGGRPLVQGRAKKADSYGRHDSSQHWTDEWQDGGLGRIAPRRPAAGQAPSEKA